MFLDSGEGGTIGHLGDLNPFHQIAQGFHQQEQATNTCGESLKHSVEQQVDNQSCV